MEVPEVRYAMTGDDVRIAYQVLGSGPPAVYVPPFFHHLEGMWEQELHARVFERMAPHLTILLVEPRGTGLSDFFDETPTLDQRVMDIEAVVDDMSMESVNLIGNFAGAQMCVGFAARHPSRAERLVLANARLGRARMEEANRLKPDAPGDYAYNYRTEAATIEMASRLGIGLTEERLTQIAASSPTALEHPEYLRWLPRYERLWGSRDAVDRQARSIAPLEISDIAPSVHQPVLLTHTAENGIIHVGYARLLEQLIPNAELVEFEGGDHYYWFGRNWRTSPSSPVRRSSSQPNADSRPCCSPTSSSRRASRSRPATPTGATCSISTTAPPSGWSSHIRDEWSSTPETACLRHSTHLRTPSMQHSTCAGSLPLWE